MEGLFIIIGIIVWIVKASNKVKQNKPGQSGSPQQQAMPQRSVPTPPAAPAQRTVVPPMTATPDGQQGDFWRSMGQVMKEAAREMLDEDAAAGKPAQRANPNDLSGDDHRVCLHDDSEDLSGDDELVCLHGSLEGTSSGGSLPSAAQQGGRVAPARPSKREAVEAAKAQPAAALPAMTAREMRQAVVMAEILKRPEERRAEQARRWAAR